MKKLHEAVLIVFKHRDLIFMVKRQDHLSIFPGYHSFPGGKVDAKDWGKLQSASAKLNGLPDHLINALARELQEEVLFDFWPNLSKGNILSITKLGIATTPAFNPHRFSTHFFCLVLDQRPIFQLDPNEIEKGGWQTPQEWLKLYQQGDMLLVPPVITLLKDLSAGCKLEGDIVMNLAYDEATEVPCIESLYGLRQLPVLSHTLPPHNRTNAFVIGDEECFLVDPSPESTQEMEKLLRTVSKLVPSLVGLFLTHSHPDHYEHSAEIARRLSVPLLLSEDTHRRITSAPGGKDFFKGVETKFIREGDILTRWLGQKVLVYAVPGHDEGQLALAPENLKWFLVGDLIQGTGTVVISPPEGNMGKYFASLSRIIQMSPRVIVPSHGIAMGGTYRLQETLKHRRLREAQVLECLQMGLSEDEILSKIYPDLDSVLRSLARRNIVAHIEKLKEEGKA